MKKLFFLILVIAGCNYSQKVTPVNKKTDSTTKATVNSLHTTPDSNLRKALLNPFAVTSLCIGPSEDGGTPYTIKHLPSDIGKFTNLKVLEIHCLENIEDLPVEIGNLKSLETLDMDEGNGCVMNVSIPSSIGRLINLKRLILDGVLDVEGIRRFDNDKVSSEQLKMKRLPKEIENLQNLEVLDLGRNGLKSIPSQVFALKKLRTLGLDYNEIHEIPASISNLTNLKELTLLSDSVKNLPESMKVFKGLKLSLGNNYLKLNDQKRLKEEFPNIVFSFDNEYDDAAANEEPK